MKFLAFISSTMLIVLISQHSTMGLPFNDTTAGDGCPEGYVKIDGQCQTISSTTVASANKFELPLAANMTSNEEKSIKKPTLFNNDGGCPKGFKPGKDGICEKMNSSETSTVTVESLPTETTTINAKFPPTETTFVTGKSLPIETTTIMAKPTSVETTTVYEEKPIVKPTSAPNLGRCPNGMKRGRNGVCIRMKPLATSTINTELLPTETAPVITESTPAETTTLNEEKPIIELTISNNFGGCPKGMRRGRNGVCIRMKPLATSTLNTESSSAESTANDAELSPTETMITVEKKPIVKPTPPKNFGGCPTGMTRGRNGVCIRMKPLATSTINTEPSSAESTANGAELSPTETMPTVEETPIVKPTPPKTFGGCPKGMKRDKTGICKAVKSSATSTIKTESSGEVNLTACPEGTKRDEDGSCQGAKSSSNNNQMVNPKVFLRKDGSCPTNYKMIQGQCLYIKSEVANKFLRKPSENYLLSGLRPRVGKDETGQVDLVPILRDNSCPEGTDYSEYGLCQKRIGPCPTGTALINGKCLRKSSTKPLGFSTTTNIPQGVTTIIAARPIVPSQPSESFSEVNSVTKPSLAPQPTIPDQSGESSSEANSVAMNPIPRQ